MQDMSQKLLEKATMLSQKLLKKAMILCQKLAQKVRAQLRLKLPCCKHSETRGKLCS